MIVVYKEMKDGKIQLTKQELEELLNKARQEGYTDGHKDGTRLMINTPIISTRTTPTRWSDITWTC